LHKLARRGLEVEREARPVTVYRLEVLRVELPEVEIAVACSKGTYVRTLAHDLGQALGCGAHLTALRRTRSGPFSETDCVSLDSLEELQSDDGLPLLSPREALPHMVPVEMAEEAAKRLANGIPPQVGDCRGLERCRAGDPVILENGGRVLAIARFAPGRERERRGDFELLRVFSRPDIW
jgi:tRNA pseudouridine55 synthase